MTHPTDAAIAQANELMACPFCGSADVSAFQLRHDERSGYNVTLTVSCNQCAAGIDTESKRDKAGWCNEKADSQFARAAAAWNRRTPARELDAEKGGWKLEGDSIIAFDENGVPYTPPAQSAESVQVASNPGAILSNAEAVERVARAIAAADEVPGTPEWDALHPDTRDDYRRMARAAIAAMQAGE